MDTTRLKQLVQSIWDNDIVPTLHEYIRIPNQSPDFDPNWEAHGYMEEAVQLAYNWVAARDIPNSRLDILRIEGRTPLLLLEVEGSLPGTVLLYGHLDKQPPFEGWRSDEGLGPWTPVERDGKLYGRGGADDGYAVFASVAAIEALHDQNIAHPRLVVVIECSEESGSPDLPHYLNAHEERVGRPDLVVCLDSGCGDYDRLWSTTSLRGIVTGSLTVNVLTEGVHSGDASGVVASSFRIARHVLSRLEDPETGRIVPDSLHAPIPESRKQQAAQAADVLSSAVFDKFPFAGNMRPMSDERAELVLNRTWRPALSITGQDGMPLLENSGNVLRPSTSLKLSLRVPPTLSAEGAIGIVKELLEANPPYGATVTFTPDHPGDGWEAPEIAPWLASSVAEASQTFFGNAPCAMGEGGSIPFMGMLGAKFPQAQFLITGVLGPHSNAHGPNEFLHLDCASKLTACVAKVIADFPR
jgi:acetylornithine deacetylase/succinyl-diaminopimelate desuccinylase-like protein